MKNSAGQDGRPADISLKFYQNGALDTARYTSHTTVREESLEHGRLIGLYWSASGQVQREYISRQYFLQDRDSLLHPLGAFELEIDGQQLHNRWQWVTAYERAGSRPGTAEAVVELKHQVRPVSVKVVTRLDGTPALARWLEISNTGDNPAALASVSPWCGVLWDTQTKWNPSVATHESLFSLGYHRGQSASEEGDFLWTAVPPRETLRLERTKGRNYGPPTFILRNEITGELFYVALAWSANWFAEFTHKFDNLLSFRVGPLAPAPQRIIAPGETVISPEVHVAPLHADFDSAVQMWHDHMRASVVPPRPEGKEMYTLAGRVVEYPHEWILREIDIAREMGLEGFMVDAGWYGDEFMHWTHQRGDWFEGKWLPGGMAGVRDHAHEKGMLFGLWIDPESVGDKSRLAREHPDWLLMTDTDRLPFGRMALNLGKPEVARFFEDTILRVVRDFKLDFLKIDYNIQVGEGGQNVRSGYAESEFWRHYETLYGIFDRIRREMPQVALENCAGGGGRSDLGMAARFHYSCQSDFNWFPNSIRAINALTLFLPPEAICYYHNHNIHSHQMTDLDTHLRVTLFTNAIFVGFGAQDADRSTPYFEKTKRYIALAKDFCYPIMAERAVVYHHTPDIGLSRPAEWCVLEYAALDYSRGYAGIFSLTGRRDEQGRRQYVFRPRGLDIERDYMVTFGNRGRTVRVSGMELANNGLTLQLDTALTSELLLFAALEAKT